MRKFIIAIDGYSACGKSTTAREVARILGYKYIDSGAMYRAVTHYFNDHHVSLSNPGEVIKALGYIEISFQVTSKGSTATFLNGLNVERKIRKMKVSEQVSQVSAIKEVRTAMVEQQRKLGRNRGIVMDGRDIGSVVFPDAELKLFLTADIQVRAYRRQKELFEKEELVDLKTIISNLRNRDELDSNRKESPLVKAADALDIDTTFVTIDEQVDQVIQLIISRLTEYLTTSR